MDQIDPRQRMRWQPCQQLSGIAGEQPDVADAMGFDLGQNFCHAVDVGLAADESDICKGARFRNQMLAAAKSDFEPDVANRRLEQLSETVRRGAADIERQMRQQVFDQVSLTDAELVPLAAAEERAARMRDGAVV